MVSWVIYINVNTSRFLDIFFVFDNHWKIRFPEKESKMSFQSFHQSLGESWILATKPIFLIWIENIILDLCAKFLKSLYNRINMSNPKSFSYSQSVNQTDSGWTYVHPLRSLSAGVVNFAILRFHVSYTLIRCSINLHILIIFYTTIV